MTLETRAEIRARVHRGYAWIRAQEGKLPLSLARVNPETLDMASPTSCVLAQASKLEYETALYAFAPWWAVGVAGALVSFWLGRDALDWWARRHGFTPERGSATTARMLQQEWCEAIWAHL